MMRHEQHPLYIFGASGHAKVVIDSVEREGRYVIQGVFDDNHALWGQDVFGYTVLGGLERLKDRTIALLIAIGDNPTRAYLSECFAQRGFAFAKAFHPSASLSRGVTIGSGTVVMAGGIINADAEIGEHVILNTGASVDHDCFVGNFAHIAPGARLCGGVHVGERALIGAGATVIPNVRIGADVIIGAGATVIRAIPDGVSAVGTPAHIVRR